MPGQLAVDRFKHGFAGVGLDQPLLEYPDRGAVGDLATVAQPHKTLEAQTVEQVKFHLVVAQIEQLLDQQHTRS